MHSIFVYFKAPTANRKRAQLAIDDLGSGIAASTGASFDSARRVDQAGRARESAGTDTWLEHYRCADDKTALAVLTTLNHLEPTHPLLALIEGGFEGRHLEHFVSASACV